MVILFDFSADGLNDLECQNYIPTGGGPGWYDVIGNLGAAKTAIERYNAKIIFDGNEYTNYWELDAAVFKVLFRLETGGAS